MFRGSASYAAVMEDYQEDAGPFIVSVNPQMQFCGEIISGAYRYQNNGYGSIRNVRFDQCSETQQVPDIPRK